MMVTFAMAVLLERIPMTMGRTQLVMNVGLLGSWVGQVFTLTLRAEPCALRVFWSDWGLALRPNLAHTSAATCHIDCGLLTRFKFAGPGCVPVHAVLAA